MRSCDFQRGFTKLDRTSVMANDFDTILPEIRDRSQKVAPKELDMIDLPDTLADLLHVHNLEVCNINLLSMEHSVVKERLRRPGYQPKPIFDDSIISGFHPGGPWPHYDEEGK